MPYISQKTLVKLISSKGEDTEDQVSVNYQNFGPGQLDKWKSLIEGEENSWLKIESKSTSSNQKKKVIFSNALIKNFAPTEVELALFHTLIKYFDVYLWPGENISIADCKPLSSANEFFKIRETIKPATEDSVKKSLSLQGVSTEDYTILDFHSYSTLLDKFYVKNLGIPPVINDTLDLTNLAPFTKETFDFILKSIDPKKIKKIILLKPNKQEINFIKELTKSLDVKIEIQNATQTWCDESLSLFDDNKVILDMENCEYLALPKLNMKSLSFKNGSKLKRILIPKEFKHNLEELDISDCPLLPLTEIYTDIHYSNLLRGTDLSPCKKLKSVILYKTLYTQCVQQDMLGASKEVKISQPIPHESKSNQAEPEPNYLFVFGDFKELDLKTNPGILILNECQHSGKINPDNQIEDLIIQYGNIPDLSQFKMLRSLTIIGCDLKKLDLSQFPNIQSTKCFNCPKLNEILFAPNNQLKIFSEKGSYALKALDFTLCQELESITSQTPTISEYNLNHLKKLKHFEQGPIVESIFSPMDLPKACTEQKPFINALAQFKQTLTDLPVTDYSLNFILSFFSTHSDLFGLEHIERFIIDSKKYENEEKNGPDLTSKCRKGIISDLIQEGNTIYSDLLNRLDSLFFSLKKGEPFDPYLLVKIVISDKKLITKMLTFKYRSDIMSHCLENNFSESLKKYIELQRKEGVRWPLTRTLRTEIEKAGFAYRPTFIKRDRCVCKSCGLVVHGWQPWDNPWRGHDFKKHTPEFQKAAEIEGARFSQIKPLSELGKIPSKEELITLNNINIKFNGTNELTHFSVNNELCNLITLEFKEAKSINSVSIHAPSAKLNGNFDQCVNLRNFDIELDVPGRFLPSLGNPSPSSRFNAPAARRVSLFNISDEISPDSDITTKVSTTPDEALKVVIESKDFVPDHSLRINVFDKIIFSDNKDLKFVGQDRRFYAIADKIPTIEIVKLAELIKQAKQGDFCLGALEGILEPGKFYPLPTHTNCSKEAFETFCEGDNDVSIYWEESHKLFYIRSNSDKTQAVKIFYKFKADPLYQNINATDTIITEEKPLLSTDLTDKIKSLIKSIPELQIFEEKIPNEIKLQRLKAYCLSFRDDALPSKPNTLLDTLLDCIKYKRGVCRHRSQAFMLLAYYIGIPARMIGNGIHAFCEVNYTAGWKCFDVGGSLIHDLTSEDRYTRSESFLGDKFKQAQIHHS